MNTNAASAQSTTSQIDTGIDVPETFVEQHAQAVANLQAFVAAVENYAPGFPGANAALQEAMRPLRVPNGVNMTNALQWANNAIEAEEKALAFELQKEAALATLKAAEHHRRDAERVALRARKAWVALSAPVRPTLKMGSAKASKTGSASNASALRAAA